MEPIRFPFNKRKAAAAVAYVVSQEPDIEPVKLALLLWMAERESYLQYGRPLFGGSWIATEIGPVNEDVCRDWLRLDSPWLPHARFTTWRRGTWA